jgi:hypothetical protein
MGISLGKCDPWQIWGKGYGYEVFFGCCRELVGIKVGDLNNLLGTKVGSGAKHIFYFFGKGFLGFGEDTVRVDYG